MLTLLWDASALIKRYTEETGHETVNALFSRSPAPVMRTTVWGYAETFSVLLRKRNGGLLTTAQWAKAAAALQAETLNGPAFEFVFMSDADVLAGLSLMQKHNINATDAAVLVVFLRYAQAVGPADTCVLVASDTRLVRAAEAELLGVFNPETAAPAESDAL